MLTLKQIFGAINGFCTTLKIVCRKVELIELSL